MRIVLASESPFRKRALDLLGVAYETCPSRIDEKGIRDSDPAELTRKLAEAKARKVAGDCTDAVIVSGDAVVAKQGRIFEKPWDREEAREFLGQLSGSEFQFITSLAVFHAPTGRMRSVVEASTIRFRPLLEREIQAYIRKYRFRNSPGPSRATPCCFSQRASPAATTSSPPFP